jgi:hypothetical protein
MRIEETLVVGLAATAVLTPSKYTDARGLIANSAMVTVRSGTINFAFDQDTNVATAGHQMTVGSIFRLESVEDIQAVRFYGVEASNLFVTYQWSGI